jgi:hypothetical protein
MKRFLVLFLCAGWLFFAGCKDLSSPTDPTPTTPDCEKYNTCTVTFENKSVNNYTYDVIWDGSRLTTLAPWTKSQAYTVSAGTHTLHFMRSNSSREACTQSTPSLAQCMSYTYWCSY